MLCYNQVCSICWLQDSGATIEEQKGEIINTAASSESKYSLGLWALKVSSAAVRGVTLKKRELRRTRLGGKWSGEKNYSWAVLSTWWFGCGEHSEDSDVMPECCLPVP